MNINKFINFLSDDLQLKTVLEELEKEFSRAKWRCDNTTITGVEIINASFPDQSCLEFVAHKSESEFYLKLNLINSFGKLTLDCFPCDSKSIVKTFKFSRERVAQMILEGEHE
jgi:hypothetical protein